MFKIRNAVCAFDGATGEFDYLPFTPTSEVNNLPSRTVPDMTIPFRELVDRHLNGGRVKTFTPAYTGPDKSITDGIERMDKMDRAMFARQLGDFVADSRGKLLTRKQAERKAANDRAVIEAHEARKAAANTVEKVVSDTVVSDPRPGKSKE